jgi:spore coat polysaccharide biosynthesis protein SpsF
MERWVESGGQNLMSIGAIIACRMDSERLPGKVLKEAGGRPLLGHVLDRCRRVSWLASHVVIATSERQVDDPIAAFAGEERVPVFRGSLDDVAGRLLGAAQEHELDFFFRVNADSPFLEPALFQQAAALLDENDYDLVTNLFPRSFPYGVSVELIRTAALASTRPAFASPDDSEHVTRFFYANSHRLRIRNLCRQGEDLSRIRLTVDTPEDWERFQQIMSLSTPGELVSYETAMNFCERLVPA